MLDKARLTMDERADIESYYKQLPEIKLSVVTASEEGVTVSIEVLNLTENLV